jgi:hypothetical protein
MHQKSQHPRGAVWRRGCCCVWRLLKAPERIAVDNHPNTPGVSRSSQNGNLPLTEAHYTMLTRASGIAEDVIRERGYHSIQGASAYTELKALGFSKQQATPSTGLLLPLHTTDGQQPLTIFRPDHPQLDAKGRLRKYLLPKGASVRLDCPPRCLPHLKDPHTPLWITEGQKKADSLASVGAVSICLLGVWNFKGKNAMGGTTFLGDWDYVTLPGREVRLVFDSDVLTLIGVRKAVDRLTCNGSIS